VAVELQALLATDQRPLVTFWTLVQKIHWRR
jgi:hypothetical protein